MQAFANTMNSVIVMTDCGLCFIVHAHQSAPGFRSTVYRCNKLSRLVHLEQVFAPLHHQTPVPPHPQLHVQVCEALQADPVDIPAMSAALRYIGIGLTKEIGKIKEEASHSLPIALKAAPIKPFYDYSLQHLSDLSGAIDHRGPPGLTTYDRDKPQV